MNGVFVYKLDNMGKVHSQLHHGTGLVAQVYDSTLDPVDLYLKKKIRSLRKSSAKTIIWSPHDLCPVWHTFCSVKNVVIIFNDPTCSRHGDARPCFTANVCDVTKRQEVAPFWCNNGQYIYISCHLSTSMSRHCVASPGELEPLSPTPCWVYSSRWYSNSDLGLLFHHAKEMGKTGLGMAGRCHNLSSPLGAPQYLKSGHLIST